MSARTAEVLRGPLLAAAGAVVAGFGTTGGAALTAGFSLLVVGLWLAWRDD